MKRRVIKQGHNTLTITLPSDWVSKFGVKPGEEIDLIEQGKNLVITPNGDSDSELAPITIDITGLSTPLIWRLVSSAYRAGHNQVKIIFENKPFDDLYTAFTYNTLKNKQSQELSPLEAIQSLVNRFVGVEIIDQKNNYCIIQELSEISPKEFDNALRRIFRLLTTLSQGVVDAIDCNLEGLKAAHIVDTNIDRFEDYCLRILNKKGYAQFEKTPTIYTLIFTLELVGDEYKKIAGHMISLGKISPVLASVIHHMDEMMKKYYELYYAFSQQKAEELFKLGEDRFLFDDKTISKLNDKEKEILHHLKKVSRFIINLTELRIDLEYI